jgi:2-polyprenyl-3-methyl-5-hydroxy-6-metoxy-1,4-benzoquinol methylase
MEKDRTRMRELQAEHARRGDGLGWFEALYREANGDTTTIPWADRGPNPMLVKWHQRAGAMFAGRACLVVGCGLGDDAEYLATQGGEVTAFDLSESAIQWCRRRFPASRVNYIAANLLELPAEFSRRFQFIFEANTLQAMPAGLRSSAMESIARCCAPGGTVLVLCRGRERYDVVEGPPWPLTLEELEGFPRTGLRQASFEDVIDGEGVRRFLVAYGT